MRSVSRKAFESRQLSAEIGNALALVRLVQQGAARHAASAEQYLRVERRQEPPRFLDAVKAEEASPEIKECVRLLDKAAKRLVGSHEEGEAFCLLLA